MNNQLGIPGLKSIRQTLELSQKKIALAVSVNEYYISLLENGRRDCTQGLQRRIAAFIQCDVLDLLGNPTQQRLSDIKVAFRRAELTAAETEAQEKEVA